jgi:hypothetical protein
MGTEREKRKGNTGTKKKEKGRQRVKGDGKKFL